MSMQIQINTDNSIQGREKLSEHFQSVIENKLSRFSDRITRLEVHFSDENGPKGGSADKRCMIEARLEGIQPIAVDHEAGTIELALNGAADKLFRLIDGLLERKNKY